MDGNTERGTRDEGRDTGGHPAPSLNSGTPTDDRPARDTDRPVPTPGDAGHTPPSPHPEPTGRGTERRWLPRLRRAGRGTGNAPALGTPPVPKTHRVSHGTRDARRPQARTRRPARPQGKADTAIQMFGQLTYSNTRAGRIGLRALAVAIALSLVAIVIAPPALSAQDILAWARLNSPDAGLGLEQGWPWVVFLAMDFAAAVCVLVSLYCAFRDEPPGVFGLGVWAFAGITAFANYQFNTVPGAPGDGFWFFPAMSLVGPVLLHAMIKKIRGWVLKAAGGQRGRRPKFAVADWVPILGSPQATFGAWRIGGLLGISKPDDALFAFRALSRRRGWWRRWAVNGAVRAALDDALNIELSDAEEMHPRLKDLLVPAIDGPAPGDAGDAGDAVAGDDRPAFPDPLDELENDLMGDPPRTPRERGTRPAPVSAPPSSRPASPRPPSFEGHGTGGDGTLGTGHHGTPDSGPRRPASPAGDGTGDVGTRDTTGRGTEDTFDPDLIRYADHILAITEVHRNWQRDFPGVRAAKRAIDAHWRKIGRATKPGGEPGFNSTSTTERVLEAMNRLAVQPGITQEIDLLRARQDRGTDQN